MFQEPTNPMARHFGKQNQRDVERGLVKYIVHHYGSYGYKTFITRAANALAAVDNLAVFFPSYESIRFVKKG